ncbi:hypothetical protein AX16_005989 [Volvariella volvacea WC 439]|nr:hypothetical protein AX16_005989 [Volvariella volvacea WC 439]
MATLTRTKQPSSISEAVPPVDSAVPAPFPKELLEQRADAPPASSDRDRPADSQAGPSPAPGVQELAVQGTLHELLPSIAGVQRSCLMTLNDLLSASTRWTPIVPDRRHSMPPSPHEIAPSYADPESSSALLTLVSNLRNRDSAEGMIEFALALVSLLSHFNRLSTLLASAQPLVGQLPPETPYQTSPEATSNLYDALKRQLSDFQLGRLASHPETLAPGMPPVMAVEAALLWSRVDEELEAVVSMCKERTESLHRMSVDDYFPPQYDAYDSVDALPEYELGTRASLDDAKSLSRHSTLAPSTSGQLNEKMRLDLEAVTMAIDRLYIVAPQLNNQRVELNSLKRAQMERARQKNASKSQVSLGKQKERDVKDLEDLLDQLGRANNRALTNQTVMLEHNKLQDKLEQARLRDIAKKEAFVEQLAEHSSSRRLHSQDATFPRDRVRETNPLLTLPEFIREGLPPEVIRQQQNDPRTLLTLPEFVRETPYRPPRPPREQQQQESVAKAAKKGKRDRSLSAPSLFWLKSHSAAGSKAKNLNVQLPSTSQATSTTTGFDVHYVAENHENLHHILMFVSITGVSPGLDIEAEVLPPFPESNLEGGDLVLIRSNNAANTSANTAHATGTGTPPQSLLPLSLPGKTAPGKKAVMVQNGHYELKLPTVSSALDQYQHHHVAGTLNPNPPRSHLEEPPAALLDATQLTELSPTSFVCIYCSLPLVHSGSGSGKIDEYKDLPSEHWQELIDAWMCHADQKLHEHVARHGRSGFWPAPGQAYVGGSYILFEGSAVASYNLAAASAADQRKVRCGSVSFAFFGLFFF